MIPYESVQSIIVATQGFNRGAGAEGGHEE